MGIANLEVRHRQSEACKKARNKLDKEAKTKKNGSLFTFFGKQPKAIPIPSIVRPSAPVCGHNLPNAAVLAPSPPKVAVDQRPEPATEPIVNSFIANLQNLIDKLPASVPEASDYNKLAVFAGNPAEYDNLSLSPDELWEETLNGLFKSALGWGTEGNMDEVIRRGRKGLDGLANFVKHFVVKREVSAGLFEGKLEYLMSKIEEKSATFPCFLSPYHLPE